MAKEPKKNGDYKVGYGKPPKHTQFKKGAPSPNPGGRPRKVKDEGVDIVAILEETLTVRKNGVEYAMETFEISSRAIARRALNEKDLSAALEFIALCDQYEIIKPPPAPHHGGVLTVPKDWDMDEWVAMFKEHGPPPWPGERSGLVTEDEDS